MTDQSVMDPGDSERERLLHQVARQHEEICELRARELDIEAQSELRRVLLRDTINDRARLDAHLNEACGWAMWAGMLEREYSSLLAVIELHSPDGNCLCRFRDDCLVEVVAAARDGVHGGGA